MPTRIPFPPEIAEVYFDFDWDREAVWALDLEPEIIDRSLLDWHLDLPFWSSRRSEMLFDVEPRKVIEDMSAHPRHARRIEQADLGFSIDVMEYSGRLCIMDGTHRLAKAVLEGRAEVTVRRIPRSAIPNVKTELG